MTLRSLAASALMTVAGTGTARGAAEGEWMAGVGAGAAGAQSLSTGVAFGTEAAYGVTDSWGVRAAVELSLHGDGRRRVGVGAGIVYAWDVVRVVPFAELGLAYTHDKDSALGPQAGLGVDYLLSPRWAVGVVTRGTVDLVGSDSAWGLGGLLRLSRLF